MLYHHMDARKLSFPGQRFDLVVDKGTIDAMLCSSAGHADALAICSEAVRVLRSGGSFMVVSHLEPSSEDGSAFLSESLIPALKSQPPRWRWAIEVHKQAGDDDDEDEDEDDEEEQEKESPGDGESPCVYVVRKHERRSTRAARGKDNSPDIPIVLHEH